MTKDELTHLIEKIEKAHQAADAAEASGDDAAADAHNDEARELINILCREHHSVEAMGIAHRDPLAG